MFDLYFQNKNSFCWFLSNAPTVPKYKQKFVKKINVYDSKFVLNTLTYVDSFLLTFWNGDSTFKTLVNKLLPFKGN